ncbi:MAG: hypothetical protein ABJA67_06365, partial [Chthonomonadales bacterium]
MKLKQMSIALGFVALTAVVASSAFAQAQPGATPAAGRGQGGGRGQGQGGRGGFGGASLASVPADVLQSELKLTDDQVAKIKIAQSGVKAAQKEMQDAMAANQGGQGDPTAMREIFTKFRDVNTKATEEINGILDDKQKESAKGLLQSIGDLGQIGVGAGAYGDLKLTTDQKTAIHALITKSQKDNADKMQALRDGGDRQAMMEFFQASRAELTKKGQALLTDAQKKVAAKFPAQQ